MEIGARDHEVGRTVALAHTPTERDLGNLSSGPDGSDHDPARLGADPHQSRPEPECDEDTARIRRELDAGARLAEPGPAFHDDYIMAIVCQRERRREPTDPCSGNRDPQP